MPRKPKNPSKDFEHRFGAHVEDALRRGAWKALEDHKRAGLPLVIWRDEKVTWVSPEEFEKDLRKAGPKPKPLR
jgi:hypothetical protein